MGPITEVTAYWDNLNHPFIEVEDTAIALLRFANGALGNIVVSNSQNPGLYARIHIHGYSGATVGVQTDGGTTFIAGVTKDTKPPINDLWTIPEEEQLLSEWQEQDRARPYKIDIMSHYHLAQIQDFLQAIKEERDPMVTGKEGRKTVELIEAMYRSGHENRSLQLSQRVNRPS